MGCRGVGLEVSILAFYSDDPSLKPAGYSYFFGMTIQKIHEKEAGLVAQL